MTRFLLVISFVVMAAASASAQGQDACARDASRFCRAHINAVSYTHLTLPTNREV